MKCELSVKPIGWTCYFDKCGIWMPNVGDKNTMAELRLECAHLHSTNRPARFDPRYVQRHDVTRPTLLGLHLMASLQNAYINQCEVALDLIWATLRDRDAGYDFLNEHLVRRWHTPRQKIHIYPGKAETRYDAPRPVPSSIKIYKEDFSRYSGEVYCLHVEWRSFNGRAVKAIGIQSTADVLNFDFRAFWKKRLLFFQADPQRIGRALRHRGRKGRGRAGDLDRRKGEVVVRSAESVQELIDLWGRSLGIRRLLTPISNEAWLPPANAASTPFLVVDDAKSSIPLDTTTIPTTYLQSEP